jgi:SOS-response transcriptional repressor LexA
MHPFATKAGDELTARQQQMYDFIRGYIRDHGFSPSVREIGAALGITSPNGVLSQVRALEKKGRLTRVLNTSRSFRLVGDACDDRDPRLDELLACCRLALEAMDSPGGPGPDLRARMERAVEMTAGQEGGE